MGKAILDIGEKDNREEVADIASNIVGDRCHRSSGWISLLTR
jgi:hypothetical protein